MSEQKYSHGCDAVSVKRNDTTREVELSATIPAALFERYRKEYLKRIAKNAEIDGFRKGMAPEDMVLKRIGTSAVLREAAETAVHEELPKVFAAENILVIATPHVSVGTPKEGEALSFTAKAPLAPHVELADYKKIASKHPEPAGPFEADEKEVADALIHLKRERKRIELIEAGSAPEKAAEESSSMEAASLPDLDDAFAVSIGFENAAAFIESMKKNMANEKKSRAEDKRRAGIIDDIVSASTIQMPDIVRVWELDEIEGQFGHDIARAGTTMEAYLGHIGKSREELRNSWKDTAEKRAKTRLALDAIAAKEHIEPSPEDVSREVEHLKIHHPGVNEESLEAFVRRSLRTEMTVRFLEGKDPKVPPTTHRH